jgi:hypothetical protein
MACRTDELWPPLGCDALPGRFARRMSGVDLVESTQLGQPRQTATTGGVTLSAYEG